MEIAIPHELGSAEVRRRLTENSDQIGAGMPGGMVDITTSWPSENRMDMDIAAMGQSIAGHVDITETQVVFHIELPMMLGFVQPMVESAIRDQGRKLVAPIPD